MLLRTLDHFPHGPDHDVGPAPILAIGHFLDLGIKGGGHLEGAPDRGSVFLRRLFHGSEYTRGRITVNYRGIRRA